MSSTLLYLAIVAVWAVVLVPMWLHRDSDTPSGFTRLLARRPQAAEYDDYAFDESDAFEDSDKPLESPETEPEVTPAAPPPAFPADEEDDDLDVPEPVRRPVRQPLTNGHRRARRSAVIARRRRNTSTLTLVTVASFLAALLTPAPFWIALPPVALFAAHLALLRTATRVDAVRAAERRAVLTARAAERRAAEAAAREAAALRPTASILPFSARQAPTEVFDQFADQPKAVGD
ncbi:hypothetical protein [Actinocorallia sp. A-T 12471]|uniref:divisome protein SepX/GlpR n=1 Tax=Actinocorallia sp. A-T 12471 TaxID=3089813 RepID=UPI0029D2BCDE|nr:hypothetical protein [Actinocorallia sp. A-T 12471]MDX6738440.1 hypothetical protein [Actinocorallia sp. A-T 12471]